MSAAREWTTAPTRLCGVAVVLLSLATYLPAKQPLENPPPRILLEQRIINHRRYVAVPLVPNPRREAETSHEQWQVNSEDEYEIPRNWTYHYDPVGVNNNHFYRARMILAILAWLGAIFWPVIPAWGGTVLVFVLFALLGWKVFGPALKG